MPVRVGCGDDPSFGGGATGDPHPRAQRERADGRSVETDCGAQRQRLRVRIVEKNGAGVARHRLGHDPDRCFEHVAQFEVGRHRPIDPVERRQARHLGRQRGSGRFGGLCFPTERRLKISARQRGERDPRTS